MGDLLEKPNGVEEIQCPLCRMDNTKLYLKVKVRSSEIGIYNRDEWSLVQCQNCKLIFVIRQIKLGYGGEK